MSAADNFRNAVLAALDHAPEIIEPGKLHRFSTTDRRGDTSGWCRLFDDGRGGVFGDWRQGTSETWTAERRELMTPAQRAELARQVAQATAERQRLQRLQWAENANRIARLWSQCVPLVTGDPVTLYLKRRGLGGVWPLPKCLRYASGLPYWHDDGSTSTHPGMVASLVSPDGRMVALHRTYLARDGRKADVPTPKKLTGTAGPLDGACIPLHQPRAGVIGIAEGIETALAAWCAAGLPTVAAYSAGSMAAWRWPVGVQRIVVFGDHDKAGIDAAEKLRARASAAGLRCQVTAPAEPGYDWADVWASRDAAIVGGVA